MPLNLILMRHAKSGWDDPLLADHDRPLNARGRTSAVAMGKWLRERGYAPDQILSSSSCRTQETCELLGLEVKAQFTRALYLAGVAAMMEQLQGASGRVVLMLGHNPGIGEFAERLAVTAPTHPRFFDYPTCATTVFTFDCENWRDVGFGSGQVQDFAVPRDLP